MSLLVQLTLDKSLASGTIQLVSIVSRILDTKRLARHYGLKTTQNFDYLDSIGVYIVRQLDSPPAHIFRQYISSKMKTRH